MKNELNELLQKEMDRKSFIKHIGFGVAALTGIGAMIKTLNSFGGSKKVGTQDSLGYGSSVYGGTKKVT